MAVLGPVRACEGLRVTHWILYFGCGHWTLCQFSVAQALSFYPAGCWFPRMNLLLFHLGIWQPSPICLLLCFKIYLIFIQLPGLLEKMLSLNGWFQDDLGMCFLWKQGLLSGSYFHKAAIWVLGPGSNTKLISMFSASWILFRWRERMFHSCWNDCSLAPWFFS